MAARMPDTAAGFCVLDLPSVSIVLEDFDAAESVLLLLPIAGSGGVRPRVRLGTDRGAKLSR